LIDALDTVRDLPYDIGVVFRELRRGRIKIEFEHVGLEPLRSTIERFGNRTSLSIVIAALLLSSSMVVTAKVSPYVGDIPLLAFIGYISSIILGLILIISIVRRK
jgi:ubiquinone biosynthesis protein